MWLLTAGIIILLLHQIMGDREPPFFDLYNLDSTPEKGKSQWVRLLDIFILGPMGLYIGYKIARGESKDLEKIQGLGILIILYGIGTIIYNGANYNKNEKTKH